MARFSWRSFCDHYRIEYVESGPNINRNQLGIKCPLCGAADPSEHMALSLKDGWWQCRRNKAHAGSAPHYLIRLLISCSQDEAVRLVGDQAPERVQDASFLGQLQKLMGVQARAETTDGEPRPVPLPTEFKPLVPRGMGNLFWDYLKRRHYTDEQLDRLSRLYDLRYAVSGRYSYRVIVPIYTEAGVMSWTGRSINAREELRYKSLSAMDWEPMTSAPPLHNIKDLLLNEDNLGKGGEVLIVAEGPFDGIRLDFFGWPHIRGTCFFGKSVSRKQATKLINLGRRYQRKWVLLDADAKLDALQVQTDLQMGGFKIRYMEGGKDPAALSEREIKQLISEL